ncbi:MAG: malate synthase G, partial [Rhizobiaceae bacterium]|nr:malate synthase G [Rhizobiaceae bacterium]
MQHIEAHGLHIDKRLHDFLTGEALPGTGIGPDKFFAAFSAIIHDLEPGNRALLQKRDALQMRIDDWHKVHGAPSDMAAYEAFLREIGYIVPEGPDFAVTTANVDPEMAVIAGPQLVVPVMNARYALNAANARWGSLYDALYGTDAIPETDDAAKGKSYNPARGAKVIDWARGFLDQTAPLAGGSWKGVTGLAVRDGALLVTNEAGETGLRDPSQFAGYLENELCDMRILLRNHNLLIEILIDPTSEIGKSDPAGISDVWLESAITTIMDCEDSVAAVDAEDKVTVYRNWLGLM